jgi:hypothetical protein
MAMDVADFTPAEADQLRCAMGAKRSSAKMERLRVCLYEGMARNCRVSSRMTCRSWVTWGFSRLSHDGVTHDQSQIRGISSPDTGQVPVVQPINGMTAAGSEPEGVVLYVSPSGRRR